MKLKINNFKGKMFNEDLITAFSDINLGTWDQHKVISEERALDFKLEYRCDINTTHIMVGIPELFKIIIDVVGKRDTSVNDLTEMLFPLFRYIPGAIQILKVARLCHRRIDKNIILAIKTMINLFMIGTIDHINEPELSKNDNQVVAMVQNINREKSDEIVRWLEFIIFLLPKTSNSYQDLKSKFSSVFCIYIPLFSQNNLISK